MFVFSLLALVAASHGPVHHKIPKPVGSIAGIISGDDYPAGALDRNEQGSVGILIRVDTRGAVSDCIVEKSASPALDARTCEVIRQRARYKPALDRHGKPVASETHETIVWRIAEDEPEPSQAWASTVIMTYATDGQPLSCRVEVEGAKKAASAPTCSPVPLPSILRQLGPVTQLVSQQRLAFGTNPPPALGADDVLIGRQVLNLQVDAAGKVTSCNIVDESAELRGADGCQLAAPKSFVPRKGPDGQPMPFTATFALTNYIHIQRATPPVT